jgi:hypothetical protein
MQSTCLFCCDSYSYQALNWIYASFNIQNKQHTNMQSGEIWSPSSAYVHSAAAILWAGHETGVNYDLPGMVTTDLFR